MMEQKKNPQNEDQGKEMMLVPPGFMKPKDAAKRSLSAEREKIVEAYFKLLDDENKFGQDSNGIYYRDQFVITLTGRKDLSDKEIREMAKRIKLRREDAIEPDALKFSSRRCVCGKEVILLEGSGVHDLMTGSDTNRRPPPSGVSSGGDESDTTYTTGSSTSKRRTSGVSGGSRNYLTWMDEEWFGYPVTDLMNRIDPDALNFGRKNSPVVAIIDTGLDLFLSNRASRESFKLWKGPERGCTGKNEPAGYNFVADNPNVFDDHGHGTQVASVFAETFGWNREYRIMVLKAFDHTGHAGSFEQACAIYYAIENKADIIIASWGGLHFDPNVYLALEKAAGKGIKIFAAAGNYAFDISMPMTRFYPAVHGAFTLGGFYEPVPKLKNLYPVAGLSSEENDLWARSNGYEKAIAASGQSVSVIQPSYALEHPPAEPAEQFGFLADLQPYQYQNTPVQPRYRLYRNSGTSFAAPKVAGLFLRNDRHVPEGFHIPVTLQGRQIEVRKIE